MQNKSHDFPEISQILRAIKRIEDGSVEIIIHASQIVQIETKEKIRFGKSKANLTTSKAPARQLEAEQNTPSQPTGSPER